MTTEQVIEKLKEGFEAFKKLKPSENSTTVWEYIQTQLSILDYKFH
jgi:hypothetical protein